MQKRLRGRNGSGVEITGVVKVAKLGHPEPSHEGYWTETFDVTARCSDGTKLFELFHILAVPEGQMDVLAKLRNQMREYMMSEFKTIGDLDQKCIDKQSV